MHKEIFSKEQSALLPLVKSFSAKFGLVGGTAVALYIGHRRSIDFDLFTREEFDNLYLRGEILKFGKIEQAVRDENGQYTVLVNGVRLTFLQYPFPIKFQKNFEGLIKLPSLATLAAMKAYALGRRAKWKDYVDLYFIAKKYRGINRIAKTARGIFGPEFNEKMFRVQLAYFKDIDYSEKVIYLKGFETRDDLIKRDLVKFSLEE